MNFHSSNTSHEPESTSTTPLISVLSLRWRGNWWGASPPFHPGSYHQTRSYFIGRENSLSRVALRGCDRLAKIVGLNIEMTLPCLACKSSGETSAKIGLPSRFRTPLCLPPKANLFATNISSQSFGEQNAVWYPLSIIGVW
jgi:hypothetical protein